MSLDNLHPVYATMLSAASQSTRANGASTRSMGGIIAGERGAPALNFDSATVEMVNILDATLNPDVALVRTQVEAFEYVGFDGLWHTHIPDIEVTYQSGIIEYWICKPALIAKKIRLNRWRNLVADQIVPDLVDDVLIKTELSVPAVRIDTMHLMHLARQRKPGPEVDLIVEFVKNAGSTVTIADLLALLRDPRSAFASTLQAIADKHLKVDPNKPIGPATVVTLAQKECA